MKWDFLGMYVVHSTIVLGCVAHNKSQGKDHNFQCLYDFNSVDLVLFSKSSCIHTVWLKYAY